QEAGRDGLGHRDKRAQALFGYVVGPQSWKEYLHPAEVCLLTDERSGDTFRDPIYAARREGIFIVAVNCTQAAPTCFCPSMGTGPRVRGAYDLALTELAGPGKH